MTVLLFLTLFLLSIAGERSLARNQSEIIKPYENEHKGPEGHKRFQVLTFDYARTRLPFGIGSAIALATLVKIVFHNASKFTSVIPFSALEILFGLIIGGVSVLTLHFADLIKLSPAIFFLYLLPPIVFEAGYTMPLRPFFGNLGTILVYAVFGTLWNVVTIGFSLYFCSSLGLFKQPTTMLELLLFSSIISAVDPVAVLTVFEQIHVNQLLYICVFGESLLNDAVTVALYHMFESFVHIGQENIIGVDVVAGCASFFIVALGGLFIGLIWAIITALSTKYTNEIRVVQPLICLLFPYLSYVTAETFHVSGIIAIVFCGMTAKQYFKENITRSSRKTVKYFLKTISSISETIIFILLGLSTITQWTQHVFDFPFIFLALLFCLLYRLIGVFLLTFILNRGRMRKISFVDQLIMVYGGLRGAVAYGLAASLLEANTLSHPTARMYLTTTIIITFFTVFVQGTTIKPIVARLNVKLDEKRDVTLNERIFVNMTDHVTSGIEAIAGVRGMNYFNQNLFELHRTLLHHYLVHEDRKVAPGNTLEKFREISEQDAKLFIKKHGGLRLYSKKNVSKIVHTCECGRKQKPRSKSRTASMLGQADVVVMHS